MRRSFAGHLDADSSYRVGDRVPRFQRRRKMPGSPIGETIVAARVGVPRMVMMRLMTALILILLVNAAAAGGAVVVQFLFLAPAASAGRHREGRRGRFPLYSDVAQRPCRQK